MPLCCFFTPPCIVTILYPLCVLLLLLQSLHVFLPLKLRETALTYAISNGHSDIATMLVDRGADLDVKDDVSSKLIR